MMSEKCLGKSLPSLDGRCSCHSCPCQHHYSHAHRLGGLDSLPPDPKETRTRFCSWSQCASWHSETSGMLPPRARFLSWRRGHVLREAAAARRERGMWLTCSGRWDSQQAAGPLGLLPLSQVGVSSSLFPCWQAPGPFSMGSGDPLAPPQIHAALRDSASQHGEGNGGQGGEWNSLKRKIISLLSGNAYILQGAKRIRQPNWREDARKVSKTQEPGFIKAVLL